MAVGIDIVQVKRIEKLMDHENFLQRVFTKEERAYIEKRKGNAETVAGLFAGKEAVAKAIGSGIGRFAFHDVSILHGGSGQPYCSFSENGKTMLNELGLTGMDISISHQEDVAVAVATGREGLVLEENFHMDQELNLSLVKRDRKGYKSQYGKVAIVGGSVGMAGSVCLAAKAAFRTGAGLVYVVVPKSIEQVVQVKLTEAIVIGIEDEGKGYFLPSYTKETVEAITHCDCMAIGPGLGRSSGISVWLRHVMENIKIPTVLDADALFAVAQDRAILADCLSSSVITPHEMEMSRLTGSSLSHIRANRIQVAQDFAKTHDVHVLLKGAETVITDGSVFYLNNTGNPGMATAGSGDVLTGMIAGFLGFGYKKFVAIRLGAYIHGLAGDFAAADKGEDGVIASDIIEEIPYVLKELKKQAGDDLKKEAGTKLTDN